MDPASAKRSSWLNDQRARGLIYQTLLLGLIGALAWGAIDNALINMRARGIPMGFGFWNDVAGFDINLHLISYSNLSTYGRAFWVGLLNTLLIAVDLHPAGDAVGVRDRRGAALAQLAALTVCTRLHQHHAQHAAAAAVAVLVQRGSQVLAGTATVDQRRRRRLSQQPRPLLANARRAGPAPSGFWAQSSRRWPLRPDFAPGRGGGRTGPAHKRRPRSSPPRSSSDCLRS